MDTKDVLSWGTLAIAVLGAVLGLLNTWRALSGDRVRLRTRLVVEVPSGLLLGLEVVNLSSFPITLAEVGVIYRGAGRKGELLNYGKVDGVALPVRIEARDMVRVASDFLPKDYSRHHRFFATSACGSTCITAPRRMWLMSFLSLPWR